jgi:hypothetical protein
MTGFPHRPEALTAGWLTDCLQASGATRRARVVAFECGPLDPHQGMTGVLVRLHLHYDEAEPQAPRSLVAKFAQPDPEFRAMVHEMGFFEREVQFYRELAADVPVPTPRCYFAGVDPEEGWCLLLLEDLAPARNGSWVLGSTRQELEVALSTIAMMHARWWQSRRLEGAAWLTMRGALSVEQMQDVVAQCWPGFLGRLTVPVTPAIAAAGDLVANHLRAVCAHLFRSPPLTLIHHDFDGDNLFFPEVDGRLGVVILDWQLATRARAAVDVSWLIGGQCEPGARREHEVDLVRMYHTLLVEQGVRGYGFDRCWDDYRLAMLLAVARTSAAVALRPPGPPGGPWDTIVPRYCQAVSDLGVGELVDRL